MAKNIETPEWAWPIEVSEEEATLEQQLMTDEWGTLEGMKSTLIKRGIPEEVLLLEKENLVMSQGGNTETNITLSRRKNNELLAITALGRNYICQLLEPEITSPLPGIRRRSSIMNNQQARASRTGRRRT